jgi:hypothetical protein
MGTTSITGIFTSQELTLQIHRVERIGNLVIVGLDLS